MGRFINSLLSGTVFLIFMFASVATAQTMDTIGTRSSFSRCMDRSQGATPAMRDCISHEFEYQDSRLKRIYQRLLASFDEDQQKQMRQTEQAWHATMLAYCDAGKNPGQGQELGVYSCALNETTKRAAVLEYLERRIKNSKAINSF